MASVITQGADIYLVSWKWERDGGPEPRATVPKASKERRGKGRKGKRTGASPLASSLHAENNQGLRLNCQRGPYAPLRMQRHKDDCSQFSLIRQPSKDQGAGWKRGWQVTRQQGSMGTPARVLYEVGLRGGGTAAWGSPIAEDTH